MNQSEKLVLKLCKNSFLSLWSYNNPKGKDKRKELCDILVVCDPDIIIFSVKEIKIKDSGDFSLDCARWHRKAVEESCKQINGAERQINNLTNVIMNNGNIGLPLPDISRRRIHRIAVALGSKGKAPIIFGNYGKNFIHVFDEVSLNIIMRELDTITDFTKYLADKESLYKKGIKTTLCGEENLLALYLNSGREFPNNFDHIFIEEDLWKKFVRKKEYQNKKKCDKTSYVWDRLIEIFCNDFIKGNLEFGKSLNEVENVTRTMARENRFSRRILGKSFMEFMEMNRKGKVRSRIVPSISDVIYVFLACPHKEEREHRINELGSRCFIARGMFKEYKTVVGIATEKVETGKGFSLDAIYLYKEDWTSDDQDKLEYAKKEFGYFKELKMGKINEDEYPNKKD